MIYYVDICRQVRRRVLEYIQQKNNNYTKHIRRLKYMLYINGVFIGIEVLHRSAFINVSFVFG